MATWPALRSAMSIDPDTLRMFERLLITGGGILSIFLGFLLFWKADLKQLSGGTLKTEFMSVSITKVGPGIFFALFGVAVLVTSLYKPVEISRTGIRPVALSSNPDGSLYSMQGGNASSQRADKDLIMGEVKFIETPYNWVITPDFNLPSDPCSIQNQPANKKWDWHYSDKFRYQFRGYVPDQKPHFEFQNYPDPSKKNDWLG
jgi:hypothetical protein